MTENLATLYARISPRGVDERGVIQNDTVEQQLADCREFCERLGLRVIGEYSDRLLSGTKVSANRQAAVDEACVHTGYLVCRSAERLSRHPSIGMAVRDQLRQHGAGLAYQETGIQDLGSPEEEAFSTIKDAFSRYQVERNRIRIRHGMRQKRAAGFLQSRSVPIGWRPLPHAPGESARRLTEAEDEREAAEAIAVLRGIGQPWKAVLGALYAKDILNPRTGRPFTRGQAMRFRDAAEKNFALTVDECHR